MSFIKDDEQDSLKIERMILHVVGRDEEEFEPQAELEDLSQSDFFVERIRSKAASAVHEFNEGSPTKEQVRKIANSDEGFEELSQELSRRFAKSHLGNSADGAFFVVRLSCAKRGVSFVCLVKYDYREAVELFERDGKNALRQIVQAFVKERTAIQKFCLARVENGIVCSDVSAFDRMGKSPDLTRYFENFLDVRREREISEMSNQLREVIRGTLEVCKEHLPEQNVARAHDVVRGMLKGREEVDEKAISEAVFVAAGRPAEDATKLTLEKALKRKLKAQNLDGVAFRPEQRIFARKPRRLIKTHEGVVLEFPGALEGQKVVQDTLPDGGHQITIQTDRAYVTDGTLPYKPDQTG